MLVDQAVNSLRTSEELYNRYVKNRENMSYANLVCKLQYDCLVSCLKALSENLKGEYHDTTCICCLAEDYMEYNKANEFEKDPHAVDSNIFIKENICSNIKMFNYFSGACDDSEFDVAFQDIERGFCICRQMIDLCCKNKSCDQEHNTHNLREEKHFHEKNCML